jgi:hypothetical protein
MMDPVTLLFVVSALAQGEARAPEGSHARSTALARVTNERPEGLTVQGLTQLTNPGNGTTCTLLIRPGPENAAARVLSAPPDLDPGMVRSISPCVPSRP